jgi:hypothetical protein
MFAQQQVTSMNSPCISLSDFFVFVFLSLQFKQHQIHQNANKPIQEKEQER